MGNKKTTRRRWIVRPRFQLQFALLLVLMHVNVGFLYQVVLHYRVRSLVEGAGSLEAFLDIDPWTTTLPAMLIAALLSAAVVFFIGIRYSNQIVGPLPRIARVLRELARGDNPARLHFRSGDVLEELADEVNALADSLHGAGPSAEESGIAGDRKVDPESILGRVADQQSVQS